MIEALAPSSWSKGEREACMLSPIKPTKISGCDFSIMNASIGGMISLLVHELAASTLALA
jgi:hypothetical protein